MQKYGFISKPIMQNSEPTNKKQYINDFEEHNFGVTYDHIWSKHCRSSKRAQQDIQLNTN